MYLIEEKYSRYSPDNRAENAPALAHYPDVINPDIDCMNEDELRKISIVNNQSNYYDIAECHSVYNKDRYPLTARFN